MNNLEEITLIRIKFIVCKELYPINYGFYTVISKSLAETFNGITSIYRWYLYMMKIKEERNQ